MVELKDRICPKCKSQNLTVADMFMLQCSDCKHFGRYTNFPSKTDSPSDENLGAFEPKPS